MNKILKKLFFASVLMAGALVFAQEQTELQKNLIILESEMPHELNPQITQYSSDSHILSGLYEGLFAYNPVTLEPQYAIATGYKISRDKKR